MISTVLCLFAAYLLGSIPSAYYAGKWVKGIDLRQMGSGNLGFTNAWRELGAKWSLPVLAFDLLKGVPGIIMARSIQPDNEYLAIAAGLVSILGHNWTIFLGFRGGGKGVAVSAGVFFALTPYCFLIALAAFLATLLSTRFMSLASIAGAAALAFTGALFRWLHFASAPSLETFIFILIAAFLVIIRHRSNLSRIWSGEERKFQFHKKEAQS
ncbi:MAG: glycerol-3-phosphate 1-O-acyltransferase PlsY [Candidatus Omnitrophota bacterium]